MAITATLIGSGLYTDNSTMYETDSITVNSSSKVLLLFVSLRLVSSVLPEQNLTVNGLGTTWEQVQYQPYRTDGSNFFNAKYVFRALSSTVEQTLSFLSTHTVDGISWAVVELDDVDTGGENGSNAIVQSLGSSITASGTTQTLTLASFTSENNATIGFFSVAADRTYLAPPAGWSELVSISNSRLASMQVQFKNSADTALFAEFGASASTYKGNIGLEIKATSFSFSVAPTVSARTANSYTLTGTLAESGNVYAVAVLPDAVTDPTPAQIVSGLASDGNPARGEGSATGVTAFELTVTGAGLSANPAHDLHVVGRKVAS